MKTEKKGKSVTVTAGKDLSGKNSKEFIETMKELIAEGVTRFTLDFSNVEFIDTLSLSNLIIFCNMNELDFSFKNVHTTLKNLFDVLRLEKKVLYE